MTPEQSQESVIDSAKKKEKTSFPLLIIGPANSGKSSFAQNYLTGKKKTGVIGTAPSTDEQNRSSYAYLKDSRPNHWIQVDANENLIETVTELPKDLDQIIIDSLNQWIAQFLISKTNRYDYDQLSSLVLSEADKLCSEISRRGYQDILIVTSEVAGGVVPANPSARLFRYLCGRVNMMIAKQCRSVILLTAGIPLKIK